MSKVAFDYWEPMVCRVKGIIFKEVKENKLSLHLFFSTTVMTESEMNES